MSKQSEFRQAYPGVFADVAEIFPDFDYKNPVGDRSVILTYSNPGNKVGHQQRAFLCHWAIERCTPLDLGIDMGSHRGLSPLCIHVDAFYDGVNQHPFYGGVASGDVVADASAEKLPFPPKTFPLILSSHSLEHMPPKGSDSGIVDVLSRWLTLLRQGGILAMVVPDADFWDVMGSDKDHKNQWGHSDFKRRILDPLLSRGGCVLKDFDTLGNKFSFDVVIEKT